MKRRELRGKAIQAIYQVDVGQAATGEAIAHVIEEDAHRMTDDERKFVKELVTGTEEFMGDVDKLLEEFVEGWKINRIARVDLAILRLASYEIVYERETDIATILDEAVELAKEFSTDESGRFINGALAKLLPPLRERREALQ